jgi:hypothetical protein
MKQNDNGNNNTNIDTSNLTASRRGIMALIESFIENILQVKKTLFGLSISALVLAPLAIALSVFLVQDPSFFAVIQMENEFGLVLSILLGAIIIVSSLWLIAGVKQYRSISSWNKRYREYVKDKENINRKLALSWQQKNQDLDQDHSDVGLDDNDDDNNA